MLILMYVLLFIFLFAFSAGFSCSETALVSLSHYRLKKIMLKKKHLAEMFSHWLSAPHYILTAILVGNNAVNIAITTLATAIAFGIFTSVDSRIIEASVWFFVMVSVLILGEITPKILGRRYPEAISIIVMRPLYLLSVLLKPLIWLATRAVKPFSFGVGISPVKNVLSLSVEDLRRLIKESGESGSLGKTSTEMMQKVLALNEIQVGSIMTGLKDTECIDIERLKGKKHEFIDEINEIGYSRIPVIKGEKTNIVGYVNVKDTYIPAAKGEPLDIEAFIRQPVFVKKTDKVMDVMKRLKAGGVLIAIVKDENSKACGIVTVKDLMEEVVGEIIEEYESSVKAE